MIKTAPRQYGTILPGGVRSLAISSDGQYFVAGIGRDGYKILLFDKNSSNPLWSYDTGYATGTVYSVGISSDGNYIVAGAYNGNLYFFGRNNSTPIWTYKTPNWAYSVAISSDGNYALVGTVDGNGNDGIYFFETNNSTPLWSNMTGDPVWSVAISSDGKYIAIGTGYTGKQIYFFEKNSSTPLWSFDAGNDISSLAISSNGKYIVAGSNDKKVYFFDKNSSTPLWSYTTISTVESIAMSSDGQYFAAGNGVITDGVSLVYLFHLAVTPQIAINFPLINQIYGSNAPEFSITTYNLSPINTTWYTIDDGMTNHTFSGLTGFINQSAWDIMEDGAITVRFYANDSLGHVGFKDVQILKDSIIPIISIHSPLGDDIFGSKAPEFNISIIEENLVSTWYKLESFAASFPFSELTGNIDQYVWSDAPEGQITITFYARDGAGNIGVESVVVIKSIPSKIPGYNLLFLLGILCTVTILVGKKLKKS